MLATQLRPLDQLRIFGRLTTLPDDPGGTPRSWELEAGVSALATSSAEPIVAVGIGDQIALFDVAADRVLPRLTLDTPPLLLALAGRGADRLVLAAGADRETQLLTADGTSLDHFELEGTTPTITRIYTGHGTYHHNVLDEAPSWPVAVALSADGRHVAIGSSDSTIQLIDRGSGATHTLTFDWAYEERRLLGGNPDLNGALALAFSPDGEQLVSTHVHGEILIWSVSDGRLLHRVEGACGDRELAVYESRYGRIGGEHASREACGRAGAGAIRADGGAVTTSVFGGLRQRVLPTGAPAGMQLQEGLPAGMLAYRSDATLVSADGRGSLARWDPQAGTQQQLRTRGSYASVHTLTTDGRFLRTETSAGVVTWDVHRGERLDTTGPGGDCAGTLSPDGARRVRRSGEALEVISTHDGDATHALGTLPAGSGSRCRFSEDGTVLALYSWTSEREQLRFFRLDGPPGAPPPAALVPGGTGYYRQDAVVALSRDGSVAVLHTEHDLRAVQTHDGALLQILPDEAPPRPIALAPDGAAVFWAEQIEPDGPTAPLDTGLPAPPSPPPRLRLRQLALDGSTRPTTALQLDGRARALALSPDGDTILLALEAQGIVRHHLSDGQTRHSEVPRLSDGVRWLSPDVIALDQLDAWTLRRNDEALTLLATIQPFPDGSWVILGAAGAVQGSPGAQRHLLTLIGDESAPRQVPGDAAWRARQAPQLLRWALAGRIVGAVGASAPALTSPDPATGSSPPGP